MNNNDKTLNSPCLISGRSPSNQGKSYRMYINLKLFKDVLFLKLKFNNKCYDDIHINFLSSHCSPHKVLWLKSMSYHRNQHMPAYSWAVSLSSLYARHWSKSVSTEGHWKHILLQVHFPLLFLISNTKNPYIYIVLFPGYQGTIHCYTSHLTAVVCCVLTHLVLALGF